MAATDANGDMGGLPEAQALDMDWVRADLVKAAEEGDWEGVRHVVEDVLGRIYGGLIPMFPAYVPKQCPSDRIAENGAHVRGKIWIETFTKTYLPGIYVVLGPNPRAPEAPPAFASTAGLAECDWRGASGKQPTIPGFEKKNCQAEYAVSVIDPRVWAMKGVIFYRDHDDALAKWNEGCPLVIIFQVCAKQARQASQARDPPLCVVRPPAPPAEPPAAPPAAPPADPPADGHCPTCGSDTRMELSIEDDELVEPPADVPLDPPASA